MQVAYGSETLREDGAGQVEEDRDVLDEECWARVEEADGFGVDLPAGFEEGETVRRVVLHGGAISTVVSYTKATGIFSRSVWGRTLHLVKW